MPGGRTSLRLEVDRHRRPRAARAALGALALSTTIGTQPVLDRVVAEDVGDRRADRPRGSRSRPAPRARAPATSRSRSCRRPPGPSPPSPRGCSSTKSGLGFPAASYRQSEKRRSPRPSRVGALQEPGGDDLVGVDVVARQHHGRRGERRGTVPSASLLGTASRARGSASAPATAPRPRVSGLARNVRRPCPAVLRSCGCWC